tara:strand:+ start:2255 stop:3166 length:912 start_codon:yes stop_codon:yes gene_type:complete
MSSEKNKVAVILCSYNPNLSYFDKQVESISNQKHKNIYLYLYDDGSSKEKLLEMKSIISSYSLPFTITVRENNFGCCMNFLCALKEVTNYDYYCFSDQDDIWLSDKLSKGLKYLENYDLYCSSTMLINNKDEKIGINNINTKPSFKHSLIQSIAGGNTYVFNNKIRNLITDIRNLPYFSHDWFIYQLAAGNDSKIFYDLRPSVLYRLHSDNLTGTSNTFFSKLKRFKMLMRGDFLNWTDRNIKCLTGHKEVLKKNNLDIINAFNKKRSGNIFERLSIFHKDKFRRSSFMQNITFYIALILKKI